MKKILITVFLLLCIALLSAGISIFLARKPEIFNQTNRTLVVIGDVRIKKAKDNAEWQKMNTSTVLEKGDAVKTAKGSSVDVTIGSNAEKSVKVEEDAAVEFEGINPASLKVSNGKIMAAVKKLESRSSFTVKTPTAICGVRGTAWSVQASGDTTKICVFENKVYAGEVDTNTGKPKAEKHTISEGTERVLMKGKPISEAKKINEDDLADWQYWNKNVAFLREGKLLVNDFNKKENINNLNGAFGSWVVFYSDANQHCRDEFTPFEKIGDTGYGLKLDYSVNSPFSAYNGFFTKLMDIDISDYKYLVFYIKGDKRAGFTTRVIAELKNARQTGKMTVDGITDEWKKLTLPLDKFTGITNFKEMKEFVIAFTDLTATKKEGVVYIDDIYFAKSIQE